MGEFPSGKQTARTRAAFDEAIGLFPELEARLDQPAGTLSGGEQQMLALARVMMTTPKLLMIDELALGLAPITVERLMGIVRRVNADGATVILVEQSVNRAMSLAEHAFFIERGRSASTGPRPSSWAATTSCGRSSSPAPPRPGLTPSGGCPRSVILEGAILGLDYGLLSVASSSSTAPAGW